jgi:hypothetical protein
LLETEGSVMNVESSARVTDQHSETFNHSEYVFGTYYFHR